MGIAVSHREEHGRRPQAAAIGLALLSSAALLPACASEVACVDGDSVPVLCYEATSCFEGDERNAPDEEHADTTCAELGFAIDCGDGGFYDVWSMASCPE
jgi:hypothetical protein